MDEDDTDNIVKRRRSCSRKKLIFDEDSSSENEFHSDIPKKCGLRLTRSNKTKIIDSDDDNDKIESSDGKTKDRRKYEKKCRKRRKTKNTSKLVENCEVSSEEDQLKTPTKVCLQENGTNTRSSARLRKKIELKGTLRLPGRKEMPSNTQSSLSSPEKFDICRRKILKPYVQVNNFFKERSTYNADRLDPFASEGEEDFVVADDDVEESEPDESADETPKKRPRVKLKKRRKKHKVSSSSSADEESSDESHARIIGNKNLRIEDSESSGESSDIELNVSIKKERNESLILRSDSDDDENGKKSEGEVKLLPRRRNMNKEKLQKAAAGYKKIREIATSKLPLDRRRFLEREIENEVSSDIEEQLDDDIQIFGINDQENDDELAFRDSDKEFIVYSSESETEERHNQVEVEFKICLENLRHSSSHFHGAALKDKDNSPICETKMVEDRSKYRRIKLEYDSDDDINDNHVKELFKNLRKLPCDIAVIQRLLQENKGLVNRTDNHMKCPLHIASVIGNDDAVSVLLDNGADVNAVDENKLPSIAFAAYWKHPTVLKLLLRKTNLPMMHRLVHANLNGMSLLHLVLLDRDLIDSEDIETRQIECLRVIKGCSSIMYSSLLEKADKKQRKPILIAIAEGLSKCVKELLDDNDQLKHYRTELEGTVLHYAVMHSVDWNKDSKSSTIHLLTSHFEDMVNIPDKNGFTPLMYAAEIGDAECMKDLIDHGAVVDLQDNHGTSALHLAAAIGSTECVKLLLSHGHPVDILDDCGWPPLLYANFLSCESCVIELMKAKPKQLFVLSSLLKDCDEKQKEKNMQVIKQTILSLANQDSYFQIFNEFIRENPTLLDEFNFGIFSTTWKAILDFDNKQKWFRRRIQKLRNPHMSCCTLTVRRERVLESAMSYLEGFSNIDIQHLGVEFHDEPGMCTGPKREFLACLCNQIIQPEMKLFTRIDDQQYSPTPLSFFADVLWNRSNFTATPMGSNTTTSPIKAKDSIIHAVVRRDHMPQNLITREKMMSIKVELNEKLRAMTFIGKFVAACIADGWYINLQLSKPFIKQILGETLNHPDDLQSVDQSLYNGAVKSTLEGSVEGLELPNSISCSNPWLDSCVEEIMLNKAESVLTDTNKREFALSVSKFKLSDSIDREVKAFKRGFFEEISSDLISIFTAGEFSLLMNGIQNISVDDWKENTEYAGWSCSDSEIIWFWRTVESLKQEEKALLLKFSTGSPCVPIGGFKELEGLGGKKRFEISKKPEESNTIPTAATCFNILRLSPFTSEKELREKVLIALRHGSEGFAFN